MLPATRIARGRNDFMQEQINGVLLNYEVSGPGEDLLLLHGWGHDLHAWDQVVPELEKKYRVWRLDLPGFGKSSLPGREWGLRQYAEVVGRFVQAHRLQDLILVGHSFGGRIAILLASNQPRWLKQIVLIDSAGLIPKRTLKKFTVLILARVGSFLVRVLPRETKEKLSRRFRLLMGAEDYANAGFLEPIFLKIVRQDLASELKDITVPTGIIWGEQDAITPLEQARRLERGIVGAKLVVLPGVGHVPFEENPSLFIIALRGLLNTPS